ncbi:hypothetical protein ACFVP3_36480 [Streptomyces sp. NPDC057806]|uniref:hypothetical protein n=1 Tax=unclassified Streptomyces TaxID=2593676 RepID=UPI0036952B89
MGRDEDYKKRLRMLQDLRESARGAARGGAAGLAGDHTLHASNVRAGRDYAQGEIDKLTPQKGSSQEADAKLEAATVVRDTLNRVLGED